MEELHSNKTNIPRIYSVKVRNLLRGIIGENDRYKIEKTFKRIKKIGSVSDYKSSLNIIRENDLFRMNSVSRDFNRACPVGLPELVQFTQQEIIDKINSHEGKVIDLLHLYRKVLVLIQREQYDVALDLCHQIIDNEGVTCYLLRVVFYIKNHIENDNALDKIENIFIKIQIKNVRYIVNAIRELSNPKTDYFNICKKINSSSKENPLNYIARSFVSHVVSDKDVFLDTLNAFYSFSLLDSFLYLAGSSRLKMSFTECLYSETFSSEIIDAFNSLSNVKINISLYICDKYDGMDLDLFRECFLLIEMNDCFRYKTIQGALYNTDESKEDKRSQIERKLINDYYGNVKSLSDLRNTRHGNSGLSLDKYSADNCSFLENSNALLFYIENNDAEISGQEEFFMELMSFTREIGLICPSQYLQKINNNAEAKELKLVLLCLMSIKDNSQIVDHGLRKIIQEVAELRFNSNIKDLVVYIYTISPSVTNYLMQICDETFLSKLFHITEKPNKAIEDRADMLEWYGVKTNDSSYIERAKNLRIDVQISKQKGTIDDSRIYVDPLKFTQWINDNILNNLTLLLDIDTLKKEVNTSSINWNNVLNGISYNEQIAALLLRCYSEFCNNNLFGIASYLGRRIRHGTFKGTGLKEVKDFSTNEKYAHLLEYDEFSGSYDCWVESYDGMLEELKNYYLHIKSKNKPNGMICSEFNTNSKKAIANRLFIDVLKSYKENKNNVEMPYIITEYCWRIIEEDLAGIRKLLMENKSKHAVFNYHGSSAGLGRKDVNAFCQELNSVTAEKFRTISSWFNKPSIASPSTDIVMLFNAVVSEIKGFFKYFNPEVLQDDNYYNISGGLYFVIYDALFILIYNAAKYGKEKSLLEFKITSLSEDQAINISITSEVNDEEELLKSKKLIQFALDADFENAHIIEGRSGIKKLKRMEKDRYISEVSYSFSGNKISASFNFRVEF